MIIANTLSLKCDGLDCDCLRFNSTTSNPVEARRQAGEAGWIHRPVDDTDWGPGHRPFIKITEV